jgi:transcriptional regulator GlxA family with amidase domain
MSRGDTRAAGHRQENRMRDRSAATRFGVVIYRGVEAIDIGGTVGVISMARRVLPAPALEAVTIAAEPVPVALAGGLTVVAQFDFTDALGRDPLIVCGGPGWPARGRGRLAWRFPPPPACPPIASVCTGALILAAAGALDGRAATTRRHAVGGEARSRSRCCPNWVPASRRGKH